MSANIARIRQRLEGANVTLIAVSKYVGLDLMIEAYNEGVTEFGESRVPDALAKQEQMPPDMAQHIRWHFIGHLQTNKVRKAVGRFALIHSVDSLRLAKELNSTAEKENSKQAVLLQVKVVPDPGKSGFAPQELKDSFATILSMNSLKLDGLMTMAPLTEDQTVLKKCFDGLRTLRDELQEKFSISLPELSMGMSDDWPLAVTCGATMIRVGRSIFEK